MPSSVYVFLPRNAKTAEMMPGLFSATPLRANMLFFQENISLAIGLQRPANAKNVDKIVEKEQVCPLPNSAVESYFLVIALEEMHLFPHDRAVGIGSRAFGWF
jgi:hypothetical protein